MIATLARFGTLGGGSIGPISSFGTGWTSIAAIVGSKKLHAWKLAAGGETSFTMTTGGAPDVAAITVVEIENPGSIVGLGEYGQLVNQAAATSMHFHQGANAGPGYHIVGVANWRSSTTVATVPTLSTTNSADAVMDQSGGIFAISDPIVAHSLLEMRSFGIYLGGIAAIDWTFTSTISLAWEAWHLATRS